MRVLTSVMLSSRSSSIAGHFGSFGCEPAE